jgi:hypothetical protein
MEPARPRWRIRLSTLMLLVIIAALLFALVYERAMREQERRRTEAALGVARELRAASEKQRTIAQALRAQASGDSAPAQAPQEAPKSSREPAPPSKIHLPPSPPSDRGPG